MKKQPKTVCWLSGGVSSFIAGYLMRDAIDDFIYIHIDDQHPDTLRFNADCEKALGKPIKTLQSPFYSNVADVIKARRYVNGPYGAPCTSILKIAVRKAWETQNMLNYDIAYVWGFDCTEPHRIERIKERYPEFIHYFPLRKHSLSKHDVHGILERLNIARPAMYDMGYNNNNCIGCVKGGMGYWNKIRIDFPDVFADMAQLEREVGASCIRGVYLDELDPHRGKAQEEVLQECGILCEVAMGVW